MKVTPKTLCERILDFDNIKERKNLIGFKDVILKPLDLIFYYPDNYFYEKTSLLYKKETIEEVSRLLKDSR